MSRPGSFQRRESAPVKRLLDSHLQFIPAGLIGAWEEGLPLSPSEDGWVGSLTSRQWDELCDIGDEVMKPELRKKNPRYRKTRFPFSFRPSSAAHCYLVVDAQNFQCGDPDTRLTDPRPDRTATITFFEAAYNPAWLDTPGPMKRDGRPLSTAQAFKVVGIPSTACYSANDITHYCRFSQTGRFDNWAELREAYTRVANAEKPSMADLCGVVPVPAEFVNWRAQASAGEYLLARLARSAVGDRLAQQEVEGWRMSRHLGCINDEPNPLFASGATLLELFRAPSECGEEGYPDEPVYLSTDGLRPVVRCFHRLGGEFHDLVRKAGQARALIALH